MIDFASYFVTPARAEIKRLRSEIKSTRRALRFAVKFFTDLQGEKVTQGDVRELLNEVAKMEGQR